MQIGFAELVCNQAHTLLFTYMHDSCIYTVYKFYIFSHQCDPITLNLYLVYSLQLNRKLHSFLISSMFIAFVSMGLFPHSSYIRQRRHNNMHVGIIVFVYHFPILFCRVVFL